MTTQTFTVTGMTCGHCVAAVTTELRKLGGVVDVSVDLSNGAATVTSVRPLATTDVAAAIGEAGYGLAP